MFKKKSFIALVLSLVLVISMIGPNVSFAAADQGEVSYEDKSTYQIKEDSVTVSNLQKENIEAVNTVLEEKGQTNLPENTTSIEFKTNGTSIAKTADGDSTYYAAGFWGNAWKVTKCAAFITMAVVPVFKAFKAVKALGGVKETARLLVGAGNADDFLDIAGGAAAEILGINGIKNNCF